MYRDIEDKGVILKSMRYRDSAASRGIVGVAVVKIGSDSWL